MVVLMEWSGVEWTARTGPTELATVEVADDAPGDISGPLPVHLPLIYSPASTAKTTQQTIRVTPL